MGVKSLHGLPQFLRYARTYPPPAQLMTAVAQGPLAPYGARTGAIWRIEGDELVSLARFGTTAEEAERYARIPLTLDFHICHCVTSAQTVIGPAHDVGGTKVGIVDGDFWTALINRVEGVSLVNAPLVIGDDTVGGFGFITNAEWPDDEESQGVLDVVTAVMALWLTHPLSPIPSADPLMGQGQWSFALSERQTAVMHLVEQGFSNRRISVELRLSDSTVKQEVQQVMKTMRARDRRTAAERARLLGLL